MEIIERSIPDLSSSIDSSEDSPDLEDFFSAASDSSFHDPHFEDALEDFQDLPYDPLSAYDLDDDYTIPSELLVDYEQENPVLWSESVDEAGRAETHGRTHRLCRGVYPDKE